MTHIKKYMLRLYFLANYTAISKKYVNFALEKIDKRINNIKKGKKIMMTIFAMAFAAVMFSGMVLCMGMFLKHVVNSIPEVTDINHRVSFSK